MRSHVIAGAVLATVIGWVPIALRSAPQDGSSPAAQVDEVFKEFTAPGSPGCTVGVYQGDRIVHRGAYGMANLDHDVRLNPGSVFHVASVSKQFTATAILLLEQDGKLSLDDDVRKFVPELPAFGPRITIRHLAHHTSGIRDQWDLLGLAGWRYSRDLITDDDVLQMLARQKDLNFTPGERHLYSNSGYTLMAIIVSRASGQTFRAFTTERIFTPLGMTHTRFRDSFTDVVKGQAYGYAREGAGFRLSVTNFDTAGATSLLTTVEDLARWNGNFDDPKVGGRALLNSLLTRGVLNDGRRIDYAVGISHGTYRGLATVGHGGADAGYRSAFLRFPEQKFGTAVLCNLASANPAQLTQRIADIYLAGTLQPVATASTDHAPEVALAAGQLASYAGLYWNQAEALSRRFAVQNDRLHLVQPLVPLKSLGNGLFVTMSGPPGQMVFDAGAGRPARVTVGPPTGPGDVLERTEPFQPTAAAVAAFAGTYRSDEIETVFRMVVRNGGLTLERLKAQPAPLVPLVADTFTAPPGTIRFVRDGNGRVNGFVLDGGRVRRMRFSKDAGR
jgi:CubicO group peptidase (beta-lactamase class C family)